MPSEPVGWSGKLPLIKLVQRPTVDMQGSIVICVSPLVSLMMDQKAKFTPGGIKAEFVGEQQTDSIAIKPVLSGAIELVYISPESLLANTMFRNMLLSLNYKKKLVVFVVDEAHCVKCCNIRSLLPSHVNVMALTATATNDTYKAVCQRLS
uniref:DNA 3'-5' helicase n=1 Tax=Amphimedon queenslandica TaxID=400682 RepID=A0A1X7UN26_AMPQE